MAAPGSNIIGRLQYLLGVDARDVDRDLTDVDAKVEAAMEELSRKRAIVELKGDAKQLDRELDREEARLKDFSKNKAVIQAELGTAQFNAEYANIKRRIDELKKERATVHVRINTDTSQLRAFTAALRQG